MFLRQRFRQLQRNVIAFTTHKSGSMVLHRVLNDICHLNRIRYYSPNNEGQKLPFDRIFRGTDFISRKHGCFGPIRFFVPTKALNDSSIIVHLRDPRDVLTSMFFSYCFMHFGEIEANTGYRREVAEAGIDRFVLDMVSDKYDSYKGDYGTGARYKKYIGNIYDRYMRYLATVVDQPNTTLVSYEEMVLNFNSWLRKILAAFEIDNVEEVHEAISRRHAATVETNEENIRSHKRKVTPGDYKNKLKPETIVELNRKFEQVLDKLGYSSAQYETTQIPEIRR